jgi:hypothetical protein
MGFQPLRIIAEGQMSIVDCRVHVGGVALSELVDHLPGRYVAPAKADYGPVRITVEVLPPQHETLELPEVTAA